MARLGVLFCLLFAGWVQMIFANDSAMVSISRPFGYARFEFGEVRGGGNPDLTTDKRWRQISSIGLQFKAIIDKRLAVNLHARAAQYLAIEQLTSTPDNMAIREAYGTYSFGDVNRSPLELTAGMFNMKYNPYSQVLGEYLFRSGICPQWVTSYYEFPMARQQGFRAGGTIGPADNFLRYDIVFYSEPLFRPQFDWSLGAFARYSWRKSIGIGFGAVMADLIPLDKSRITFDDTKPVYDSNSVLIRTDTIHYTYQDISCAAMIHFDPKPLFGIEKYFNPSDLRIYVEVGLLGITNQRVYDNISERAPTVVGICIPAWKVLDILSVELEYFGTPFRGDPDKAGTPAPIKS